MVKRKMTSRRPGAAKRRRLAPVPRPMRYAYRPMGNCNIMRTFWKENWTLSTVSTAGFWRYYQFILSDLPSYQELTAVWDRFRINAIKVTFRPRFDNFSGNDTTDTTLPGVTNQAGNMMHVIVDPYSNTVPTGVYNSSNLNTFLEQGGVKTKSGNKPFSVYFKPTINRYVGTTAQASRIRAPYLQTSDSVNQTHNGFHIFAQDVNLTGVTGQSFDVFVTYYMSLSGVK